MASRASRVKAVSLAALALLGTAGAFVFGVLAGKGGQDYLRNIILGVICSVIPATVTAVNRFTAKRLLRAETDARERAVAERERALQSKDEAERRTAEVRIAAEAHLIFALRARLSPSLYCLGKLAAAAASDRQVAPLIGSLSQAIVAAAIGHDNSAETRRSIFFAVQGDRMRCVSYAGYEGAQDTGRTVLRSSPDDPVGQYMFGLLAEREALLIPDVEAAGLPVRFPARRSYQTIIATAIMAGDTPYGILTLDSPQPHSLGQPDLEIMKTLANLLGVGLALAARGDSRRPPQVPAQGNRDVAIGNDLLVSAAGSLRWRPNCERGEGHAVESGESRRSRVNCLDRAPRGQPQRRGLLRVGVAPGAQRGGARPGTSQAA